tara:strand:+ start:149 stop:373 length:225 start_codon:yes stop_codon:yes gene_type:complete
MVDNIIIFKTKEVYGQTLLYPVCQKAEFLVDFCKRKTLTGREAWMYAKRMNMKLVVYFAPTLGVENPTLDQLSA